MTTVFFGALILASVVLWTVVLYFEIKNRPVIAAWESRYQARKRIIYKIVSAAEWALARKTGAIAPAPVDEKDGFIHLSTEDQVLDTARLHFTGRDDLVAVAFEAAAFGAALKWEPSRGGALFPHLYGELPVAHAKNARRLVRGADGTFAFGEPVAL